MNSSCKKILPSNRHTYFWMLYFCTLSQRYVTEFFPHSRMFKLLVFGLFSVLCILRFLAIRSEDNKVFVYHCMLIFTNHDVRFPDKLFWKISSGEIITGKEVHRLAGMITHRENCHVSERQVRVTKFCQNQFGKLQHVMFYRITTAL